MQSYMELTPQTLQHLCVLWRSQLLQGWAIRTVVPALGGVEIISSFRSSSGFSCENSWPPGDLTMFIYLLSSAGLLSGTFGTWGFKP